MNTDELKRISIRNFLARSGITPVRENPSGGMYLSPLRDERTASFHVDYARNLWYDHGTGEGGSVIDLVMKLQNCTFLKACASLEKGPDTVLRSR